MVVHTVEQDLVLLLQCCEWVQLILWTPSFGLHATHIGAMVFNTWVGFVHTVGQGVALLLFRQLDRGASNTRSPSCFADKESEHLITNKLWFAHMNSAGKTSSVCMMGSHSKETQSCVQLDQVRLLGMYPRHGKVRCGIRAQLHEIKLSLQATGKRVAHGLV